MGYYKSFDTTENIVKNIVIPRKIDSRKGENGIIMVIGGSKIYHGAPILASYSALRSGIDLVYTAVPKSIVIPVRTFCPDFIVIPLVDEKLTVGSANRLVSSLPKTPHSVAIGMGMSISKPDALKILVDKFIQKKCKLVLDASALIPEIIPIIQNTNSIVTPHAGEFKRLFSQDINNESTDRQILMVNKLSEKYGITIILKGFNNIISNGEQYSVINRSTPAMTVGGTGDILAGLIAGFLTKYDTFNSSILGVYFNGIAGYNVYKKYGFHIAASDIINELPVVLKEYDKMDT